MQTGHVGRRARKTCRAIASSLRHSDLLITNMIGLRLQEWTARDAADRSDALAERRRLPWKMPQPGFVTLAMSQARQISMVFADENEVEGIDAIRRASGQTLEPPADWHPPQLAPASTARSLP